MSHHHDTEPKPCPNCGFPATNNYCAQCGQETHLHKDSFFGMIWHFVGHYFHYDSKFWKTLKKLWFSPGKLTVEYFEGKRARSIPPISLYIFISAVYFLAAFLIPSFDGSEHESKKTLAADTQQHVTQATSTAADSAARLKAQRPLRRGSAQVKQISRQLRDLEEKDEAAEKFLHQVPKIFFFMIPFTAFILRLLFLRRKSAPFAYHAVFSLHVHSFFFSLSMVDAILPFELMASAAENALLAVLSLTFTSYFVLAMRNTYRLSYARAISYTVFIGFVYILVIFLIIVAMLIRLAVQYGSGEVSTHF